SKCLWKAVAKQPTDASGSTARTSADKGKGIVELEEVLERGPSGAEVVDHLQIKPVLDRGSVVRGVLAGGSTPHLAKQVYECCSEELMNRAGKSAGLHFASALINQIHDASRLVQSQHEKILTFWAVNKELKTGVGQELVAVTERQAKELEGEVKKMRTELESLRSQRREIEQEVGLLCSSFDGARND
ncbi:hypothetical protein BHE74_00050095, partial [Ensete ventricosum]